MIKNIIKTPDFISVTLDDGTVLVSYDATPEMFSRLKGMTDNNAIISLLCPSDNEEDGYRPSEDVLEALSGEFESDYITFSNNRAYLEDISQLTLPPEFVEKFIAAEKAGDESLIQTYLNFWTLVSMNPNPEVRNNLFWFINKWGIKITKSGLLITYRNAVHKYDGKFTASEVASITRDYMKVKGWKKSPKNYCYNEDGELIEYSNKPDGTVFFKSLYDLYQEATDPANTMTFTDAHSHTTSIKLGQPVSMPRELCDADQHHTCSSGLHQASAGWLENNYFGDTGLVCLVNPANCVAVPPEDSYGKMRVCEYLPIAIAKFGADGHIIEDATTDGFEDDLLLDYAGKVNNADLDDYTLGYTGTVGIDREAIADRIMRMAQHHEC